MPFLLGRLSFGLSSNGKQVREGSGGKVFPTVQTEEPRGDRRKESVSQPLSPSLAMRLVRRLSNPTPVPLPLRSVHEKSNKPPANKSKGKGNPSSHSDGLENYVKRAEAYSRSSPDLSTLSRSYQPWPSSDFDYEGGEAMRRVVSTSSSTEDDHRRIVSTSTTAPNPMARYAAKAARSLTSLLLPATTKIVPPPLPSLTTTHSASTPILTHATSSPALTSSPLLHLDPSSSTEFCPPHPSPSPPLSVDAILAARAEALAKLTEPISPVRPYRPPISLVPSTQPSASSPRSSGSYPNSPLRKNFSDPHLNMSDVEQEFEDEMRRGVRRVKRFIEREVGDGCLEERYGNFEVDYDKRGKVDEQRMWEGLRSGVVLCRLLNRLVPGCPIPTDQIDHRGLTDSSSRNLDLFLVAASESFLFKTDDLFIPYDLLSGQREGLLNVLRTLSLIEGQVQPKSNRERGNRKSSSSIPIDINLRGRVIRAKSLNVGAGSSVGSLIRDSRSTTYSSGSGTTADGSRLSGSPDSSNTTNSRITSDSSFGSSGVGNLRKSVELSGNYERPISPPTVLAPPLPRTSSVTFSVNEEDWGSPGGSSGNVKKNTIYGDRRMAESAVDILTVVEEDEPAFSGFLRATAATSRSSYSAYSGHRLDRDPPSPSPRRTRFYSDAPALSTPSILSPSSRHVKQSLHLPPPQTRSRQNSDAAQHPRLNLKRSFSDSRASRAQREELGPVRIDQDMSSNRISRANSKTSMVSESPSSRTLLSTPATSSFLPFPLSTSGTSISSLATTTSLPTPTPTRTRSPSYASKPPRPNQHKRWNSELYVTDSPVKKELRPEYGGVGGGSFVRSRHESYQSRSEAAMKSKGEGTGKVARTKLVLREDGKPTLTYQLGECIGKGQFGSVYRALNLNSGRVVAVKRIQLEGKTEEEVSQLSNEVSLLKSLVHPGVVKYEGLVRTEHYLNIILEYVENGSLQKTIKHFGELPEPLVASYVVKILEGLSYLHQQQVVHCDLKAANILSTKNGNVKLSDFGVSLNLNAVQNITKDVNEVNGTPNWMAPEIIQLKGASTASDIWSLACTIIELITGRPPYAELLAMSAMFRIVEDDMPPIPARCSPELVNFLSLCFRKDPSERPTANELFDHEWLSKNWDPIKDLRPQDSIPFLRRISTEMRRPELDSNGIRILEQSSPSPADLAFYSSSPALVRSPLASLDIGARGSSEPGFGYRGSLDLPRLNSWDTTHSSERQLAAPFEEHLLQAHAFVKTTFSKPVECRLCHEQTKRHAVLCQTCGLISHARCSASAPLPCDLRQQLLNYSNSPDYAARPPQTSPISASSPGFHLAVILPFGKSRKAKDSAPAPLSNSPSDMSPLSAAAHSLHPSATPRRDLRRARTQSPDTTPPASKPGSIGSYQSLQTRMEEIASNAGSHDGMFEDIGIEEALQASRPTEVPTKSGSPGSTKLVKRRSCSQSHTRTQSQGVVRRKVSEGECLIM